LNGEPAATAAGIFANFAAFGRYCADVAAGMREHYGFGDDACAFFDFFAADVPEIAAVPELRAAVLDHPRRRVPGLTAPGVAVPAGPVPEIPVPGTGSGAGERPRHARFAEWRGFGRAFRGIRGSGGECRAFRFPEAFRPGRSQCAARP
jgi:hypothetical protein